MLHVQVESVRLIDDKGEPVLTEIKLPVSATDKQYIRALVRKFGPIQQPVAPIST